MVLARKSLNRLFYQISKFTLSEVFHRPARLDMYRQFVSRDALCFDVGANMGSRVEVFLRLGARVVAIDPQPVCIAKLNRRFGRNPRVTIVPMGLAEQEGQQEFLISDSKHQVSSMSPEWIRRLGTRDKSFHEKLWSSKCVVPITTLDALIAQYGTPNFCKIDVEGYEPQVLSGLSQPLASLSFEYTPEYLQLAETCVKRLSQLGAYEYNYSAGESMRFGLDSWVDAEGIIRVLPTLLGLTSNGDIYARLIPAQRENPSQSLNGSPEAGHS